MERLTKRMGGISYSMCDNVIIAKCENCTHRQPSCYDEDCQSELDVTTRLAAYEDTGLAPEQVARFRWIPVSERLPEKSQNCLCAFCDGSMAICWHNGEPYKFHPDVTHWMPLPEPPKEADHE